MGQERTKEVAERPFPWGPVFIAGGVVIGGYGLYRLLQLFQEPGLTPEEQAALIEDAKLETQEMIAYERAAAADGEFSDAEETVLDTMAAQIEGKMEYAERGGKTFIERLLSEIRETVETMGLYLPALAAGLIVGPHLGRYLVAKIKKRWPPQDPPNFPCDKCGAILATEGELRSHIQTQHPVTRASLAEAQAQFHSLSPSVQMAIAIEAETYEKIYKPWEQLSDRELQDIAYGASVCAAYALAAYWIIIILRFLPLLLLI